MLTMLLYVLIVGLVAALLFLVASALFGRSEELGPLPEGTTVTVLPAEGIDGSDVRALRFQQVFRGYKAGEVDWALTRLAARIDELERELAAAQVHTVTNAEQPDDGDSPEGEEPVERPLEGLAGPDPAPRPVVAEPGESTSTPVPRVLTSEPELREEPSEK